MLEIANSTPRASYLSSSTPKWQVKLSSALWTMSTTTVVMGHEGHESQRRTVADHR